MSNLLAFVVAACIALPLTASAQLASSDAAIKHRQAAFTLMSTYFARINSVIKGERPFDRPKVMADAQLVETISRLPWVGFAPGSDSGKTPPAGIAPDPGLSPLQACRQTRARSVRAPRFARSPAAPPAILWPRTRR